MRSLIVDDDAVSRRILAEILAPYGSYDQVGSGKEALAAFSAAHEARAAYDLICLDIQMPDMDGQETLSELRVIEARLAIPSAQAVKVIMTTVKVDKTSIFTAFRQCEAYLIKPVDAESLLLNLEQFGLVPWTNRKTR
jgi:two-component system chemotaxis response regulator CheY